MPIQALDGQLPDDVLAFLDTAVSVRGRRHWEWKYGGATAAAPGAFYWQEADGRILGFIGLMRTALHAGGARHAAAWFVDWHVMPGPHAVGAGMGLLRKAEAAAGILLTLQGSPDTRQILPRLGWKESLAAETWLRPLSRRYVADWTARRAPAWLRLPARAIGAAAASILFGAGAATEPDGVELVDVDRLPAGYDTVWDARAAEFPAMRRDAAYVNRFCADYPDRGYRLQLVRRRGATVGHLITRCDDGIRGWRRGRLVDLLWPRADAELAAWLVRRAVANLRGAGADYVECLTSIPELTTALARERFRRRTTVPLWYHRLPAGVPDPAEWYVTLLDCDRAYR